MEREGGGAKKMQGAMRLRYRFTGERTRISSSRNIEKYLSANFYHCFLHQVYTLAAKCAAPDYNKILPRV